MKRLKLSKEPSNKTVELYIQILIINIILSLFIYMIAPDKIAGNYHNGIFSNYENKIKILTPLLMQLIFIPMSFILGAILAFKMQLQPKSFQRWQKNILGFLTGADVGDEKVEVIAQKTVNIIFLVI